MAGELQQHIASIEAKAQVLVERYNRLCELQRQAEEIIAELKAAIADRDNRLAQLESEVAFLRNSIALAPTADDVDRTRRIVSELVREIDKCIRDLSE